MPFSATDRVFRFSGFALDIDRGTIARDEKQIFLRPKTFTLLTHLARNMGRVVPKQELMETVWPGVFVTEDSLTQAVREIRKTLGGDLVRTISRRGYMLAAATQAAPKLGHGPVLAVVRFRNDSGDPQDNLITDGIAEDLISAMARFGNLTVLARNTSFSFTSYDPSEWQRVRAQTGADYIVEGSVRRQDKTISVAVNLVDAATEEHLWGNRYLAEDIGIFPVQRQIVEEIIGRLVTRVGHVGLQRASRKDVANLAAYEAVLCGIQLMRDPAQSDLDGAATYFTAAIEKDPAYGLAYTYLALSRSIVGEFGPNNLDELERARELADKGAALSPDQATCRRIQSLVRIFLREHQAAEQYLKLALELNPLDAECIEQMGFLLTLRGRPIDALSWLARAIQLNPLHPHWYQYDRSLALYLSGDYRAAAEVLNLSTRLTPWIRTRLAACHAQLGEMDVAYRHIALARESHPDFSPADYAANGVPFENPSDAAHLADGILLALGQTPQS